jgi:diaminopimelate epimerase
VGITKNKTKFLAIDGEHQSIVISENNNISTISLKMLDVNKIEVYDDFYFINTGSPHYVKFINNINNFDVYNKGKKIRYDKKFILTGTNVDFVEIIKNAIFVRTYERGVENETLSCGTGVIASALATAIKTGSNNDFFNIQTKGGNLKVSFKKYNNSFTDIWLEGPVSFVFKGEINYSDIL